LREKKYLVEKLLTEEESMEGKVRQRNFDKDAFTEHEGNVEEKNNGYVVFECKIYRSAVIGYRRRRYSARPHPFL
jgi:hypothetical protein